MNLYRALFLLLEKRTYDAIYYNLRTQMRLPTMCLQMKKVQFKLSAPIFIAFNALYSSQVLWSPIVEKSIALLLIQPLCKQKAKINCQMK